MSDNPPGDTPDNRSHPPCADPLAGPSPLKVLTATIQHRLASLSLDLSFNLTQPWTILFGPSGSGKTTILRILAGFVRLESATILYGPLDRVLVDTGKRLFVPPHRRPVRTAGQAPRLFPQLSVRDNVSYGLGEPYARAAAGRRLLDDVLALMRVAALADRRPAALSGGERQRVSVARAVAAAIAFDGPGKALLLLDEPFAGLDTVLRDELAFDLRNWLAHRKVPVLSVSHDVGECHLLEAEVLRIADGKLLSQGPAATVLAVERERLLARLGSRP